MQAQSFLNINGEPIFLGVALHYLYQSGKLQDTIYEILRQYVLRKEVEVRLDLDINSPLVEQEIENFRNQFQLVDASAFQAWLNSNNLDYMSFYHEIKLRLMLEQLKQQIVQDKIFDYFIDQKLYLDKFVLSQIVLENSEIAEELATQIREGISFERLAADHSIAEDRIFNGMMGLVSRKDIPDALRAMFDSASPGTLIGPVKVDEYWCLYRMERFLPASLDSETLKQSLQDEIWEHWLAERIQRLEVTIQVNS